MNKKIIPGFIKATLMFVFIVFLFFPLNGHANKQTVYIVPVSDTVEKGLAAFLERAVKTAQEEGGEAIIFEINTPGGAVDAAGEIGRILSNADIRTISYVNKNALSAGAYIALNTDEIYMAPGSSMGAAAVIDQEGNAADEKAQSYWLSAMKGAAEESGRDPEIALAMADKEIDLPEYGAPKGKLLTLTSAQAEKVGYSEGTAASLDELLSLLGYEDANVVEIKESIAEKIARFVTHPVIIPILLTIGSLGLVLELYSPGFGLPGAMGISALLLFFYGHLVAGFAGYEALLLFVVGIGLLVLEIFLPGGIAGIIGAAAIVGSFFLASENIVHMGISVLIAIGISVIVSILMVKVFGRKMKIFRKIVLTDATKTEEGYVSNENRTELLGLEGYTLTPLRPSGTVLIGDERIDVVSEGSFIQKDRRVRVVKTEGARIVVREVPDLNKKE